MTLYDDMAECALDMLTEFGAEAVIRRNNAAPVNTTTTTAPAPWAAPESSIVEYPCKAVVSNYSESVLDGSAIKHGDKKIIVAASGLAIEPAVTDVIVCSGIAYNIVSVTVVSPAGTPIIYVVQARL